MKPIEDTNITIAFSNLTKEDLLRITSEFRIDRKRAIKIARVYNLDFEVKWCIDYCGKTPQEALAEWDLL